jgi:hypothetical protein
MSNVPGLAYQAAILYQNQDIQGPDFFISASFPASERAGKKGDQFGQ